MIIKKYNKIKAGFGISVVDSTSTGKVIEREILYINNDGDLNVNQINLGTDTNSDNNILLSAKDNNLLINGEPIIKQTTIDNLFSNDSHGNLIISYNGKKYKLTQM